MTDKTNTIFNGIKKLSSALNIVPGEIVDLLEKYKYLTDDDVFLINLYFHNDGDPSNSNTKELKYTVGVNECNCHIETCVCDDWAIFSPNGERWDTFFKRELAQKEVDKLNNINT